ncbi:MAG: N-acetylmuramoyl-L-alanine amidase family protein [Butyricicoccus sp.]
MKLVSFRVKPKKQTEKKIETAKISRSRKRRKRKNYRPLIVMCGFILLVFAVVALLFATRFALSREIDESVTYVGGIPVHTDYLEEGAAGRPGEKREIKYVVIHETDNTRAGADAEGHNQFIHSNGLTEELSWHYTVDDHEIWHHIPDDETAFHAGDHMEEDGGNKNGIGVEMCVNADGDYEQTLRNAQKLAAELLHKYDLTIDGLKKHQDFSGKNCPSQLLNAGRWEEFRQGVADELAKLE